MGRVYDRHKLGCDDKTMEDYKWRMHLNNSPCFLEKIFNIWPVNHKSIICD